jgi:hypothetical protein
MFTIKSYLLPALSFFATAQSVNIPLIVKHVHLMGELKELFAKKTEVRGKPVPAAKTPTLSYLKAVDDGKVSVSPWVWGGKSAKETIKEYKKEYGTIIDQAIEREQEFCSDYYVFYHGLPNSFHVFQDFLKQFNAFIEIAAKKPNFEFLRTWHEAAKSIDANTWLASNGGYDINTLIFVNLSLFGNLQNSISHSFGYFKDNSKASIILTETLLKKLFTHYGLNTSYVKELINLNQRYLTKEGKLIQFFIPKDKVDRYVFLGAGSAAPYYTPIDSSIWDSGLRRHTKIGPILDKYTEDAGSIAGFDLLQACILSSKDFLLNPSEDIKMFKYVTITEKDLGAYQKELTSICNKIFSEWIDNKDCKNTANTGLGRLLEFMK